jgi:N utilization substance protein B
MTSDAKAGLSGNQKRKMKSAARFFAVQALYQMEQSGQTFDQVRLEFLDHRFGEEFDGYAMLEGDADLFTLLLQEAVNHQALIDQMTDRALVAKWPLGRIDSTLRGLFRAAGHGRSVQKR